MLDLTPKTHVNRSGVLINPCKTCQPVGALFGGGRVLRDLNGRDRVIEIRE